MRALSDFTTLIALNLLMILCSIPIVTAGAAYTSLHYCIMKMVDGEGHLTREFFKQFKLNLKSSTPVWLAFLFGIGFIYLDFKLFAPKEGGFAPILVPVYMIIVVLAVLFVWIFPLMARIENSFSAQFKNAAILGVGRLPRTLLMILIYGVAAVIFTQDMRLLPIAFVVGISLPTYFGVLVYHSVIKDIIERMQAVTKEQRAVMQDEDESSIETF